LKRHKGIEEEIMSNVLIAIDDDHFAALIGDFVCKHQWQADTTFRLLTVLPWLPSEKETRVSPDMQKLVEQTKTNRKALLDEFGQRLASAYPEARVDHEILQGNAAEIILETAESWPADLIIVGSHGRKGMSLFLLGSVSNAVVSHAPCSVVVIRPSGKDKSDTKTPKQASSNKA
jgi:nucleotide-binding universal stress UspA family protein